MNRAEISERLEKAIQKLMKNDRDLLISDVNERSITHRLAMYLQEEFPDLDVDCEYNRYGFETKRVKDFYPADAKTDDTNARTVFPDIIVHKRGAQGPNVLVIEAKKSTTKDDGLDIHKLEAYKSNENLKYEHAVFLVFRTANTNPGVEQPTFV